MKITDEDFDKIINDSDIPVVVDFYAPWCGPCRHMEPIIKEASAELEGVASIYSMNIDENEETMSKFNISSVPTIMLFNEGNEVHRQIGVMSKTDIKDMIKKYTGSK